MRQAEVYLRKHLAGLLTEISPNEYVFRYTDEYFLDSTMPSISLTLSKSKQEHRASSLFPFFYNMLSEGSNKALQSQILRVDEKDSFGLLLKTAQYDTIGAVTIKPIDDDE